MDLSDTEYSFPQHIVTTDLRPNLVIWNDTSKSITIIELTIAFETAFEHAPERKRLKYSNLERRCQRNGFNVKLITVEIGSRSFINTASSDSLYNVVRVNKKERKKLEMKVIRSCILRSYDIWCKKFGKTLFKVTIYILTL